MKLFSTKANFAWFLVILGGIVEIFWVSGLKYANSPFLYILTIVGIGFSFASMLVAVRYIEVSIAYSVFVGIGTLGVILAEMLVFNESFSMLKLAFILLLLAGIIGLKFQSRHHADLSDKELVHNLGEDLGLHELDDEFFKDEGGGR
ncbi:DMT family transporter [Campylobacter troglodytis]|uniref:DMT family transporter n=1 Tax=Campylobacter troglodytis TaxID=654363 RepID=UPI0011596AD9|nr:multidrug efflux SMR transporter [Campylobacter troglodytis]TQR60750.1 QacE family quaternary ammonium compound efflux SMR transporter [Campylobacter troglodytis]